MKEWAHRLLDFGTMTIAVPEVDYPWISEWEWEAEEETGRVLRLYNGEPVLLYHEILKHHQEDELFYILSYDQLVKHYRGTGQIEELTRLWEERRDLGMTLGVAPPPAVETLGCALSGALHLYLEWYYDGLVYTYRSDPEGITPGEIFSRKRRGSVSHQTLGEFLQELSGDWEPDEESPAGMIPMIYEDLLVHTMMQVMGLLMSQYNSKEPEEVWEMYEKHGLSLSELAKLAHEMIEDYPLPTEAELRL